MESGTRGAVTIQVDGETIEVRFTWASIDKIETTFGADWHSRVDQLHNQHMPDIATLLAAATDRPVEFWYDASPPIVPTIATLQRALSLAFFGVEPPSENPPTARSARLRRFLTIFGSGSDGQETPPRSGP